MVKTQYDFFQLSVYMHNSLKSYGLSANFAQRTVAESMLW